MDGMRYYSGVVDNTSVSYHVEIPQSNTIGQLSVCYLSADTSRASAGCNIQFRHVEFVDSSGNSGQRNFFNPVFSQSGLTRVDWTVIGAGVQVTWLANLFFWPSVS